MAPISNNILILADKIISHLKADGHINSVKESDLEKILDATAELCRPIQPLIELDAPVIMFGDIHGHLADLQRFLKHVGYPSETSCNFLFLGDFVDRGSKGLEVAMQLICFKLRFPDKVHLLRGNHEDAQTNRRYGFYNECRKKRSVLIWKKIQHVFDELPLAARVSEKIIAMHGGLSPHIVGWESLRELKKPLCTKDLQDGILCDLIWADPCDQEEGVGFTPNEDRGVSFKFGEDQIEEITDRLEVDLVVRGHEVPRNRKGYRFGEGKRVLTLFSAFAYQDFKNQASILKVSPDLKLHFISLVKKKEKSLWQRLNQSESEPDSSYDDDITVREVRKKC